MSTTLTQSVTASFPDRPAQGGVGLQVSMSIGDEGSYLSYDMGAAQTVFHARFVFNPLGLSGGRVVVLAGLDGLGAEALRLTYDSGSRIVSVWLPGGITLSVVLDGVIAWQCIEIAIDTVAGQADLWINGELADQATGDLSASTVQTLWFGAVQKDTNLVGDLFLDELYIADSYIGPVVVPPTLPHAGDPARWLVVYNTADPDAAAWAEAYRQVRGVPFANLLGLSLPVSETIDSVQYASLVSSVSGYLSTNQLGSQIMGILLGYRVPGYVDFTGGGPLEAVPALMQTSVTTAGVLTNANASPADYQNLTFSDLAGDRMTARIDRQDLTAANQLIDRAAALNTTGLSGNDSSIYFDPFVGSNPSYQQAFNDMIGWATGLRGMRTRLPIILSGDPGGNAEAGFSSVSGDGLFLGWSSTLPDADIFDAPAGKRAVCVQLFLEAASATTLRSAVPGNWADTPIDAGYACAVVSSRDNPISSIPDVGVFFDSLNAGWTVGEAWHVAQPMLRSGFYLVGDPLMTVSMPRQGVEVFGPLQSIKDLDPSSPLLVLPADTVDADVSGAIPSDGMSALYLVRRTDAMGRSEASTTSARAINAGGAARVQASLPIWPDAPAWPVVLEAGQVLLAIYWGVPLGSLQVASVELLSQPQGGAEMVAAQPVFDLREDHILVTAAIPPVKTMYRWRITSPDGDVQYTDGSVWVDPPASPTASLQQIGANT